jgi:hypothetical protein
LSTFTPTDQDIHCLREENIRLKQLLMLHGIPIPPPSPLAQPQTSPRKTAEVERGEERARQRIVFFRSLFRGREDVYAVKWLAAFQNPEFYKAQAMRLSTYLKPRVIACGQDFSRYIGIPRGCMTVKRKLLSKTSCSSPNSPYNKRTMNPALQAL